MLSLLLVIALLAGCGAEKPASSPAGGSTVSQSEPQKAPEPAAAPVSREPSLLTLATATQGGVFWPMGQEIAAIWNDRISNVKVTAINTGGTADNIQKLGFKEVDIGLAVSGVVYYAVTGTGEYQTQGKQSSLRGMLALHPNVIHLVVSDKSGISSLKDIKGSAWAPGARGSATEINTREILSVFNMDSGSDLRGFYVGYNETVENMKEGKVQGATLAAGIGGKAVNDALALGGWKILSLSQAEVDAVVKQYPAYFPITIPAGTYAGQTEPVLTLAQSSILIAREDVPADLVYEMTKAFYADLGRLQAKVPAAEAISREGGLKGITGVVPLHPGAERFFKEVGLVR